MYLSLQLLEYDLYAGAKSLAVVLEVLVPLGKVGSSIPQVGLLGVQPKVHMNVSKRTVFE